MPPEASATRKTGLIGHPVAHSLSAVMHNAALRHVGIDAVYELWDTPDGEVPDRVNDLRTDPHVGCNVTVPHKQRVIPLLDELTETARAIGAVNTIVRRGDRLVGDNTDASGCQAALTEALLGPQRDQALVLGAGGAARAVVSALRELGFGKIRIANRTPSRADVLANAFGAEPVRLDDAWAAMPETDLLVNATSVGWHDEELVPDDALGRLPTHAMVFDLIYRDTPLLNAAGELGLATLDGMTMLVHQGARAFELWFDVAAPVEVMRDAVATELASRW